jgi:diaminopropionate ammonia-lyase
MMAGCPRAPLRMAVHTRRFGSPGSAATVMAAEGSIPDSLGSWTERSRASDAEGMFMRAERRDGAATGTAPGAAREAEVRAFHARLPGYSATPLTGLPALAAELGVGRVLVKDESSRIGLPAFKILGASWAVARLIARRTARGGRPRRGGAGPGWGLDELRSALATAPVTLTAATDGNHGRAVARMAALLGTRADIFVPDLIGRPAADLIAAEGATVTRVGGGYDEAVRRAARHAAGTGAELVQDTAWDGYVQVPGWIVEGYRTLLAEIDDHLEPDLVVVPAGVGSLAQAVVMHYRGRRTRVVTVEPGTADCVRRSLLAGRRVTVRTGVTAMEGLNCGTPSALAWPHLRDGLSGAVAVSDAQAAAAAADLARNGVRAGPCGAATLAGLRQVPIEALGLGRDPAVVLLSTEGARP